MHEEDVAMALDADRMHAQNEWVIEEFRRTGGHVGGNFAGAPLLLLHTTGAKSGQPRTNPVMYQQVGDAFAVFASAAGDDDDPAWFRNVVANPSVTAEIGTETLRLKARVLDADEREPIWQRQKQEQPGFADYERQTSRTIPVVLLER
jgi:deazaflavin-dependent oxidoreductase (nitroreductase family)